MSANKCAVVIGVSRTSWSPRENLGADNDARLMAQVLKSIYNFPIKQIKLLLNEEATRAKIIEAIKWLKVNENAESTVVFFFSGHGGGGGGNSYIFGYDMWLSDSELKTLFSDLKSTKVFLCIQACFSGGFIPDLCGAGRIVVSSTSADSVVADGKLYSVFGSLFINQAIKHKLGDANHDGVVSVEEAFYYKGMGQICDGYEGEMIL
jgi:hypothetical protein